MDTVEFSKFAGAILLAALAIVLPKTLLEMSSQRVPHDGAQPAHVGYTIPGSELVAGAPKAGVAKAGADAKAGAAAPIANAAGPAPGGTSPPAAAPAGGSIFDAVKPLLATAKPDSGAATFKVCTACHAGEKGGANKVGPALWGIVGRPKGSADGFNYSASLKGLGGDWTYDKLAGFINNPKAYAAGTKMVYGGIADPEKLADLLAYLGTLSDNPVPLPK
jgi:cytochrome c